MTFLFISITLSCPNNWVEVTEFWNLDAKGTCQI
jgi:hypothetical protein